MPYAVTLRLDDTATERVETLFGALAERGISSSARRVGYPPHVTLAVCDDKADPAALIEATRRISEAWFPLSVSCPAMGAFPDPPIALFVMVTATEVLLQRHAALSRVLPADWLHPHYQPTAWLPHVTLADDLQPGRVAAAMAVVLPRFQPFTADLVRVEVVRFRPVRVLWQADLKPEQ